MTYPAAENRFAIIGGGASGSMVLAYLARNAANDSLTGVTFDLFDPNGFGCGGIAYGKALPGMVLNSVRTEMSPWDGPAFRDHFNAHAAHTFEARGAGGYLDFLQQETLWAIEQLRQAGAQINLHRTAVTPEQHGDKFALVDPDGKAATPPLPANRIILAAGYGPNPYFADLKPYAGNGYIHSLYDGFDPAAVSDPHSKTVAFLGSGPALYDFVNAINDDLVSLDLVVISPSGAPMGTRDLSIEGSETRITPFNMLAAGQATCEALTEAVKKDIRIAQERGATNRRIGLDIVRNLGPALAAMDEEEAIAFRNSPLVAQLRHGATPIPVESARRLQTFSPRFVKQRLRPEDISLKRGRFGIAAPDGTLHADFIVNGTGHGRHNAPVLEALKKAGLARVDPKTGVLATDEGGIALAPSGLLCLGPAVHPGTDGMESFAPGAEAIAAHIHRTAAAARAPAFVRSPWQRQQITAAPA